MKRKKLLLGITAAGLYVLLLLLLPAFERTAPDANILSVPQALWYSLTTLTTVGYGDLCPVTAAGRAIGVIFQLLSLGVLAVFVGAFVPLILGRFLPLVKLRLCRRREWFVFPEATEGAMILARSLHTEDSRRIIIFCGDFAGKSDMPFCIRSPLNPATLIKLKGDGRISVFCMNDISAENERLAQELESMKCQVYCMTEHEPDRMSECRHCFDPCDCCARLYWRRFPLCSPSEKVVIIGDGKYAEALLSFGLELNVTSSCMHVQYHVFGDYEDFQRDHRRLSAFLSVGVADPDRDSLIFWGDPWNAHPEVLSSATRIVVCSDRELSSIERLTKLQRYFPVSCPIHAKLSLPFEGVSCFGSMEELFTPELVIRAGLNDTAIRMNEIYRSSMVMHAPAWNELNSFTRRSNIASAEHLRVKIRILLGDDAVREDPLTKELCHRAYTVFSAADEGLRERYRRIEHERWMRFHLMNNWAYAEQRDNKARLHPLLVPYEGLSPEDRRKDDYAWELLDTIA